MRIFPLGSSALKIGTTGAGMTPDQLPTVPGSPTAAAAARDARAGLAAELARDRVHALLERGDRDAREVGRGVTLGLRQAARVVRGGGAPAR